MSRYIAVCNGMLLSRRREALKWSLQVLGNEITSEAFWWSRSFLSSTICVDFYNIPKRRRAAQKSNSGSSLPDNRLKLRKEIKLPTHLQLRKYSSTDSSTDQRSRNLDLKTSTPTQADFSHLERDLGEFSKILEKSKFEHYLWCWEIWTKCVVCRDDKVRRHALKLRRNFYIYLSRSTFDKEKCYQLLEEIRFHTPSEALRHYDYTNLINILVLRRDTDRIKHILKECLEKTSNSTFLHVLSWTIPRIHKSSVEVNKTQLEFDLYTFAILLIHNFEDLSHILKFKVERQTLRTVLLGSNSDTIVNILSRKMDTEKETGGALTTLCINLLANRNDAHPGLEFRLWQLKKEKGLINHSDLRSMMRSYVQKKEGQKALNLYEKYKEYHSDNNNFDVLLEAYAQLKRWKEMQGLFESLFGRGELPNKEHYRIVMESLSRIARKDIVDALFEGFINRNFRPTENILNALMYARLAFGDTKGVKDAFKQFGLFNVSPGKQSFLILLMAYRDAKDLDGAMRVLSDIERIGSTPISIEMYTTLMSLCTNRRDSVTAEEIFQKVKNHSIQPNLIFYNAYIACLSAAHQHKKAFATYEKLPELGYIPDIVTVTSVLSSAVRMKREWMVRRLLNDVLKYHLSPDAKWYSVMLDFFCDKGKLHQAEIIFREMKRSNIPIDSYHYTVMMDGYVSHRNYQRTIQLYKEMISQKIDPSFKSHSTYMLARTWQSPKGEKGEQMLEDFLGSESIIDLTSDQLSRSKIPPRLLKPLITSALAKKNFERAKEILRFYISSEKGFGYENYQVVLLGIRVYSRVQDWNKVAELWDQLMKIIPDTFVKTPRRQTMRGNRNSYIIPGRHQHSLTRAVNAKIMQLKEQGAVYDVLPLIRNLEYHGITITNSNLNLMVKSLVSDDRYVLKGFEIAEKYLMKGFTFRLWKKMTGARGSHLEPRRQLTVPTLRHLTSVYRRALLITSRRYNKDEARAFEFLNSKYPRLVFALEKRIERGRQLQVAGRLYNDSGQSQNASKN